MDAKLLLNFKKLQDVYIFFIFMLCRTYKVSDKQGKEWKFKISDVKIRIRRYVYLGLL